MQAALFAQNPVQYVEQPFELSEVNISLSQIVGLSEAAKIIIVVCLNIFSPALYTVGHFTFVHVFANY